MREFEGGRVREGQGKEGGIEGLRKRAREGE